MILLPKFCLKWRLLWLQKVREPLLWWCNNANYVMSLLTFTNPGILYQKLRVFFKTLAVSFHSSSFFLSKIKSQLLQSNATLFAFIGAYVKGLVHPLPLILDRLMRKRHPYWAVPLVNWACSWTFGEFICGLQHNSCKLLLRCTIRKLKARAVIQNRPH